MNKMKKSKILRLVKNKLITKPNIILLATLLVIVILMAVTRFFSNGQPITGLAVDIDLVNEDSIADKDVVVWQGQYFTGKTFNTGTFDFNFTVYDAKARSGRACYSNAITLTTGNFGEWKTEQTGVGTMCGNASTSYFLEIRINNKIQGERRRLMPFDYLRKVDVSGNVNASNYTLNGTTIKDWNEISSASSNAAIWNITNSAYLYNNSGILDLNETKLNSIIDARATSPNLTNYALRNQSETFAGAVNIIGNLTLGGQITTDSGCLIPNANFLAEEDGSISSGGAPAGLEYAFGDASVGSYGPRQPCPGKIVYMTIQAINAANGNGQVDIVINGAASSSCNVATPSSDGSSTQATCTLLFNAGDRLVPRTTTTPSGRNNGYVVSWWVSYD